MIEFFVCLLIMLFCGILKGIGAVFRGIGNAITDGSQRAQNRRYLAAQQAELDEINRIKAAEIRRQDEIAYQKQLEEIAKRHQKKMRELEKENAQKAAKQRKAAEARTIIEHYEPIRHDLIERIKQLEKEYKAADQVNKSGAALEKLKKPLDGAREKLFNVERKLERAYFTISE